MKSEFYRQVSHQHKMRKSTTKNKPRKQTITATHINPIRMSKGLKSQTRALIKSIDLNRKLKQSTNQRMMRMSFSRPAIQVEDDIQIPQINEKSIVSICCKCQTLKTEHEKEIKSIKMHQQQQRTAHNERFIQMQKKYLLKSSQYIKLQNNYHDILKQNQQMNHSIQAYRRQRDNLNHKLDQSDEQILKLFQELKKYQDQNKFFNHFLTAFVQQTRSMVQWCNLFDNSYQELPPPIKTVRKDLMNRKTDLDVILKESVNYQTHNFGISSIKASQNNSFFDSEEDCAQSFTKYLKQNTISTKDRYSRSIPFTQVKEQSDFSQAFTANKQNVDTSNKHCFQGLIHSRLKQHLQKQKSELVKDQLLRMLLVQAQTLESSNQMRQQGNSKSQFEVDGSLLSSISKKIDHFVQ